MKKDIFTISFALVFVAALFVLGFCLLDTTMYHIRVHSSKWELNTEIQLSEEDVEQQDYKIYSRNWHFWIFNEPGYMVVTRHNIGRKNARAIAKREPFKEGLVYFYHGPKWFKWCRTYEYGSRGAAAY